MKVFQVLAILVVGVACTVSAKGNDIQLDDPLIQEWLADQRGHVGVRAERTFVDIADGRLEGTTYVARGGDTIYAYLGIPYAKAPVGNLRFQPPQPFDEPWGVDNPRVAYLHPNACPQYLTNTTTASEDCLFVSVYTKRNSTNLTNPLPVMYWIHGGGFLLGQTSYYTGSKLLQDDVIVVTVQYRMGPLGFLSTMDDTIAGNMGMKDMVQGLKWVKDNIAAFGGDPNRVTVFGESAGGAATTFMLISPLAKGLFQGAAAMSGTAIAEWSMDREPLDTIKRLAVKLNCTDPEDTVAIHTCLMEMPWIDISKGHFEMMLGGQASELRANLAGTSPTVEHDHPGAFISKEPLELLETGEIAQVPVMLGANQHEGSFLLGIAYALRLAHDGMLDDPVYIHQKLVGDLLATWGVYENTNGASISQALISGYIPQDSLRNNFTDIQYELIDMFSALFMKAPILRTAEILSRRVPKVYFYSFEYASPSSLWNFLSLIPLIIPDLAFMIPPFDGGVTHGDDLLTMFSFPVVPTMADRAMTETYCGFFTDFATNGKPSPNWTEFTMDQPNYMQIVSQPTMKQHYPMAWKQGLTFPE